MGYQVRVHGRPVEVPEDAQDMGGVVIARHAVVIMRVGVAHNRPSLARTGLSAKPSSSRGSTEFNLSLRSVASAAAGAPALHDTGTFFTKSPFSSTKRPGRVALTHPLVGRTWEFGPVARWTRPLLPKRHPAIPFSSTTDPSGRPSRASGIIGISTDLEQIDGNRVDYERLPVDPTYTDATTFWRGLHGPGVLAGQNKNKDPRRKET